MLPCPFKTNQASQSEVKKSGKTTRFRPRRIERVAACLPRCAAGVEQVAWMPHVNERQIRDTKPKKTKTHDKNRRHNSSCPDDGPPSPGNPFPSGSSPRKCLSKIVNTSAHTHTPVNLKTSSTSACRHEGSSFSGAPPPVPAGPSGSVD